MCSSILPLEIFMFIIFTRADFYPPEYIGCFVDKGLLYESDRILPVQRPNSKLNTREKCINDCQNAGYILAGTENGDECFCGHVMKEYEKVVDSECDEPCPGNEDEFCGGRWRISIYNISKLTTAEQTTTPIPTTRNFTAKTDNVTTPTNITLSSTSKWSPRTESTIELKNTSKTELTTAEQTTTPIPTTRNFTAKTDNVTTPTNITLSSTSKWSPRTESTIELKNTSKTGEKIALWIFVTVVCILALAGIAGGTVVLLKRRREPTYMAQEIEYDAAGTTQDIYDKETELTQALVSASVQQEVVEQSERHIYGQNVTELCTDTEYNVLSLKSTNMQEPDRYYDHI